jgi:hypothetical protein
MGSLSISCVLRLIFGGAWGVYSAAADVLHAGVVHKLLHARDPDIAALEWSACEAVGHLTSDVPASRGLGFDTFLTQHRLM